ncbi:hypothetical protein EDF56_102403 [Novosphingobium sp. PhB165]|uniref:NAD(P)H-dependent amine dehydrogenase family protein n=1 Tax=Novosphingobium sp. PhB165 TaxID=2485105 RepID=UPI001052FF37|nr:hypothetical protein [Novosphingobium sp. PhB165]TCM20740.1 hypothetical protein EDF56_102403 [Novosphingobium sp. PhB165]
METMRVIQWTTGKVGKLALRGILDDPRLELAGVFAYSDEKRGVDAGTLCGRPECGVLATNDIDALIALGADAVIYTPFMADLDHAVRLLESGIDIISTNLFLNVGGIQGDTRKALEEACRKGDASLFITGVNPGWINGVAAALTAVCRDVEMVSISESADCSVYESKETWLAMGISLPEATPEVIQTSRLWMTSFYDAANRLATALGFELEELDYDIEFATASQTVDLGFMTIPKDTNAALRAGWTGKIGGRTVVKVTVAWYLTKLLNEGWKFEDDQYHLVIKGEPEVNTRIRFTPPAHWGRHEWDTMTAMPAVNAAFNVKAAPAGILTLKDVGLPCAPAGVWASAR